MLKQQQQQQQYIYDDIMKAYIIAATKHTKAHVVFVQYCIISLYYYLVVLVLCLTIDI